MMDYSEIVKDLRYCADPDTSCSLCKYFGENCEQKVIAKAADAIEELNAEVEALKHDIEWYIQINTELNGDYEKLQHAAKKMHTWIFLNTWDEQKAYDERGLSDEMNAALGYSGQFKAYIKEPKEETE
jgi:hypothetical protein